jgi:hypothetical protein
MEFSNSNDQDDENDDLSSSEDFDDDESMILDNIQYGYSQIIQPTSISISSWSQNQFRKANAYCMDIDID